MTRNILTYNTFQHYGCSFTRGWDSGGDDCHDDNLSYPAHLSRIVGNNYVNKGKRGSSNAAIFYRIYDDIKHNRFQPDTVAIVNLSGFYRCSVIKEINPSIDIDPEYSFINDNNKDYRVMNFMPTSTSNGLIDMSYAYEKLDDYHFILESLRSIYGIIGLLNENKIPYVFLNMLLHGNETAPDELTRFTLNKNIQLADTIPENLRSQDGHFYSEGYKVMAENVYHIIKDVQC